MLSGDLNPAKRIFFEAGFSKKGQALIEAVVAVSVLSVGIISILALLNRSLALNRSSAERFVATYLAAEGIEVLKNIVDSNAMRKIAWTSGIQNGDYEVEYGSNSLVPYQDRFLNYDPSTRIYSYGGGSVTLFKRILRINVIGPEEIKVNSIVSWTASGGASFNVNLEDHFMNWQNVGS